MEKWVILPIFRIKRSLFGVRRAEKENILEKIHGIFTISQSP